MNDMDGCLAMFPGQGSQRPGMAAHLISHHPAARRLFAEADDVLGIPLAQICTGSTKEELARTEVTQPAIAATSIAVWTVLRAAGYQPAAVAGHSLGEYPALVAAGVLSLESALRLVQLRGRLMGEAGRTAPGAMAAVIGLGAGQVEQICAAQSSGLVTVANFNEPLQTVVSGEVGAVAEVSRGALEAGAERVVPLDVSAPFHSPLMAAVEEEFAATLVRHEFKAPQLPVISSVTGGYVRDGAEARELLRRQLTEPVRWVEVLRTAAKHPVNGYTEIGPGRVLGGLARRTLDEPDTRSTGDQRRLGALIGALSAAPVAV